MKLGSNALHPTTMPDASTFVAEWASAWNGHDIDAVLAHFHDDAIFCSPVARDLVPESLGVLQGKQQIRNYWERALDHIPDLAFVVEGFALGLDLIVIHYRNQRGMAVVEILQFEDGLVRAGHGAYPAGSENPAGLSVAPRSAQVVVRKSIGQSGKPE